MAYVHFCFIVTVSQSSGIEVVAEAGRGVESHVAAGVILVIGSRSVQPVVHVGGDAQAFRAALGHRFL